MKFEKQSSKLVKPFSPTPQTLGQYRISFIDGLHPIMNVPVILFFPPNSINRNPKFVVQLENSLEKTLPRFYPLAGRYVREIQTVICNDEGAEFIQAKVNITLEYFLAYKVNVNLLDEFIPSKTRLATDPLLAIQVTTFECGGIAIGTSAAHFMVDVSTVCTFLNEWAAMNRDQENEIEFTGPVFNSTSLFPARGVPPVQPPPMSEDDMVTKYTRKKLSFSHSEILNIKAKANANANASGKDSTRQWSKVQLVSAIIWKAFIGLYRATQNNPTEFILFQPINLRGKFASLIPKHSCGNILGCATTKCGMLETTIELADLLSDSVKKTINNYSKLYHDSEQGQTMFCNSLLEILNVPELTNENTISSWCKFPFYEADFGFGKPIWAAPATIPIKNLTVLMDDAEGNGVEAYVFLEVKDVPYFEKALDVNAFGA